MSNTTETVTEDVRVFDEAGLRALPVGTRLNGAMKSDWFGIKGDPDAYWELRDDGWHLIHGDGRASKKAYRSSGMFFWGSRPGHRITRRVLNPEILGEFRG
jgi:hypothetical protein